MQVICLTLSTIRKEWVSEWVSEWLLFNSYSANFQLYHGENNSISIDMMRYQHAELNVGSASSLKHQYTDRHVAPLGHIILILSRPVFALSP